MLVSNARLTQHAQDRHCPDRATTHQAHCAHLSLVLSEAENHGLPRAKRETVEVVRTAHAVGATVKSKIENIIGVEDAVNSAIAFQAYPPAGLPAVADRARSLADEIVGLDAPAPPLLRAFERLHRPANKVSEQFVGTRTHQ
ncbi:hypothetical protein [Georgenia subflava]|uniref:hypothetical protein n=1 Tax=Georgenia subflava TaxID=1622177 RepID=UPI00186B06D5|nr:hypothetical protein [Georgenia subflava]